MPAVRGGTLSAGLHPACRLAGAVNFSWEVISAIGTVHTSGNARGACANAALAPRSRARSPQERSTPRSEQEA